MLLHLSQLQVPNLRTATASSSVPACRSHRFHASHTSNASRASGSAGIQALGCTIFLGAACLRRRVAQKAIPTEYYGLLGLPLFTSDPKEIKAAHRRMVKLVHPDILGADSSDLQSIVTEAYTMLSDGEKKEEYDEKLRKAKPSLSKSNWSEEAPQFAMGVFVDETKCEQCYRCVNIASSTFEIHDNPVREGKAFVTLQYGDDRYVVREAIGECPSKAIRYVSREDLTKLEYAMTQCATLRHRARPWEKETIPGPYELYQELMLDELISMDMEKAVQSEADPYADTKVAEELGEDAQEILAAANRLSEEQRERIWPKGYGSEASQAAQAFEDQKNQKFGKRSTREVEEGDSRGVQRAEMKATLFYMLDRDGDGFLYDTELRPFADRVHIRTCGVTEAEEYQSLCNEYRCSPMQGMDMIAFARMLDDEEGCPLSDAELAGMLRESNQLPRAGS
eukprot:s107_g9.t1